ncbi:hypothetical protein CAAN1_05S00518 [[Candida] anglica]|uniref:Conserved oligomeric Golgi complex subunit 2 n=1 Tax=[Candida] anglica TaxID=148631 RepID=A0ABP0ED19_9ASCO
MDFPYPTTITRDDFQTTNFGPDKFLFENHRFTAVDVLIKDLQNLLNDLKQELLNIVNNDYNDFIKLGKSIDGGMDLINSILGELKDFSRSCGSAKLHLETSTNNVDHALNTKAKLIQVKNTIKLCVLITSQLDNFEKLLNSDENLYHETGRSASEHVKYLTTSYLSINRLYQVLTKSEVNSQYVTGLKVRVVNLGSEYRNYLNELVNSYKEDKLRNKDVLLELMRIYKVIGHEGDFLKLIKKN